KGRIYVDTPANPRTAILIPSNRHRVYVSGEPDPHLLADVIYLLAEESLEESYGFVMYYAPSHPWQPALEQVLQKQERDSLTRQFYRLREPSRKAPASLPEPITIGRIDETMVEDTTLVNRDLLLEEIHSESPSLEHFFRQNFGFCARDGQQLV